MKNELRKFNQKIEEGKISVMMAFICNPYLAVMQKKCYLKYWKDEVDELIINVNGRNSKIRKFIVDLWKDDDKVKFVDEVPSEQRQGQAFDSIYLLCEGEIIMTMDSDNFIYKKGVVKGLADKIRNGNYDAVGSPGHHVRPVAMAEQFVKRYGTCRLNPFMAFFRKDIINKITNLTFKAYTIEKGEKLDILEGTAEERIEMDVMTFFSLKYFQFAKSFSLIKPVLENEYIHVAALSSIFRRKFRELENSDDDPLQFRDYKIKMYYWGWYHMIYEYTKNEVPFPEYNKQFEEGVKYDMELHKMTAKDIEESCNMVKAIHKGLFI